MKQGQISQSRCIYGSLSPVGRAILEVHVTLVIICPAKHTLAKYFYRPWHRLPQALGVLLAQSYTSSSQHACLNVDLQPKKVAQAGPHPLGISLTVKHVHAHALIILFFSML